MNTPDLTKKIKKAFFFWQEICFIILLGGILISMLTDSRFSFQSTSNILLISMLIFSLICLSGQFRWRNICVAHVLAVLFGISSFYMMFATLYEIQEVREAGLSPGGLWFGSCLFFGFLIISVTMSIKYLIKQDDEPQV